MASMWRDEIYIDHCAMEGLSSSGNIQGLPADALVALLSWHGVDKVLKWVDDFCLFRTPTPIVLDEMSGLSRHYSMDIESILAFTSPLGVPWHPITEKGQVFTSTVPYVGFLWDLDRHTVSLSTKKRLKYLDKVLAFQTLTTSKVSRKHCMSIHGTLQHITFVYKQGRSSLPPLSAFISKFPNDFALHHVPKSILECLKWWIAVLQNPSTLRSLVPQTVIDPHVWVDASTDWGIGVILGQLWATWRLIPGWRTDGRDIGWAESIALELAVIWLVREGFSDCNISIHGDNMGVIGAHIKGRSHNAACNESIRRIASLIIPNNIIISPVYTPSASNKADPISHGILGPLSLQLPVPLQLPDELVPYIIYV